LFLLLIKYLFFLHTIIYKINIERNQGLGYAFLGMLILRLGAQVPLAPP